MKDLEEDGFPVYGANGIIGYYHEYNHENPTILITCRGATCGTVNVCAPKSYVTGNAMCLDNLKQDVVDLDYLRHFLKSRGLDDVITGSAQPQITRTNLSRVMVPLPPLKEQKRIADILDKADEIKKSSIKIQDSKMLMIQSVFVEMFGDPIANRRNWDTITINELTTRTTKGESPKWQGFDYQEKGIRFITSENVLWGELDLEKVKWIPEEFHDKLARSKLTNEDVLINLVGASVGRTTLVCLEALPANINQAVAVVSLDSFQCKPVFLVNQLLIESMQRRLLGSAVHSARANISLTNIRELQIILPPIELQIKFENTLKIIDKMFNSIANGSKTANLLALSSTELLINQ